MAFGGDVPMDLSMLQQQQFDQARERMNGFADSYPGLAPENRHLAYGQPRQEVHRLAKEQRCDLIVVGSHGRHGLALLLGSTANDILHGAPCDVLAVRLKKRNDSPDRAAMALRGRGDQKSSTPSPALITKGRIFCSCVSSE